MRLYFPEENYIEMEFFVNFCCFYLLYGVLVEKELSGSSGGACCLQYGVSWQTRLLSICKMKNKLWKRVR